MQLLRSNPRPFVLAGIGVALLVAFAVVVAPLFTSGGAPKAEIAGEIPQHAALGQPLEIDVGLDNTGDVQISPVCIRASLTGAVTPLHAVFQGVDDVTFDHGAACGGALDGQDTISVKLFFRASAPGTARISLQPADAQATVGPPLAGSVQFDAA